MAPRSARKRVLALDPGFRNRRKLVILDAQGKLLHDEVIHPTAGSEGQKIQAGQRVAALCAQHKIEAIAIGNGDRFGASPRASSARSACPRPSSS